MSLDVLRSYFALAGSFDPLRTTLYALMLIILSSLLAVVYYFTANSLSNRSRLAAILPLMSITTMLTISIIQSSLALSLGLVGALSIVRFRSAIKDPEELAYIFLSISLGLGFGAQQPMITLIFFVIILALILGQAILRRRFQGVFTDRNSVHLELVFTSPQSLDDVTELLQQHCRNIELVRLQEGEEQVMMFLIKPRSAQALESLRTACRKLDRQSRFTLLQYQPLV